MSSVYNKNYINITYKNNKSNYPAKFCYFMFKEYNLNNKILDLGCGNGDFTEEIEKLGFNVIGADINPPKGKKYITMDIQHEIYPFNDNTFDIIFSKSVIEHLRNPEKMVDEVYRILKPGGIFICMTPSWKHSYREQFYIDHTHYTPFTRYSLKTICELSGFKSKCEYFYQLPILWKYKFLKPLIKLISIFPIPYKPFSDFPWPDNINKLLRFSKEVMLLAKVKKI